MRIHGGYGYSQEFLVERLYRDAPLLILGEGSNEIQQLVIARRLLEQYPPVRVILMLITFQWIVVAVGDHARPALDRRRIRVLMLMFQRQVEGLLGFSSTQGLPRRRPLLLFMILFGLSMNLHVFIVDESAELLDSGQSPGRYDRRDGSGRRRIWSPSAAVVMVAMFSIFASLRCCCSSSSASGSRSRS